MGGAARTNGDERELVLKSRNGNTRAFAALVELTMRRAYYAALGLVGSHEDALDLSQEAYARAFRARRSLDPERPFYAWLYTILRNLCFNHLRDRKLHRTKLEGASGWLADEASARAAELSPDRQLEVRQARERVRRAIDELPERDREMLVLKEFEGLRYREIAELIGVPLGTVMSRLYTARRRLAAVIEREEEP